MSALRTVTDRLAAAGCIAAPEEAAELVATAPSHEILEAWIRRREQGEPLPWITGRTRFCGHTVRIDPGVYVPRTQTEVLARRAAALLPAHGGWAVDLCTGAGGIAVHLMAACPSATVVGVDIDERAVRNARRNRVHAVWGEVDAPLRPMAFDVVTAVPPYVPTGHLHLLPSDVQRYEPRLALDGGTDGLDVLRRVVGAAARLLRPGGWLLVELGGEQDEGLGAPLAAAGFSEPATWCDDEGDARGLVARSGGRRPGAGRRGRRVSSVQQRVVRSDGGLERGVQGVQ